MCFRYSSTRPPAATIFSRAAALILIPRTVTACAISPLARSFACPFAERMSPAAASVSRFASAPFGSSARSARCTTCDSTRNGFVNPRFGTRRVSGICPPSKCGLLPPWPWWPDLALKSLWPLPDVLPVPDPGPRPIRLRLRCEPRAGARLCRPIFSSDTGLLLDLGHRHQVTDSLDHAAQRGRIRVRHLALVMPEAERLEIRAHPRRLAETALHLADQHFPLRERVRRGRLRAARSVPYERPSHALPPSTWRANGIRASPARRQARVRSALLL